MDRLPKFTPGDRVQADSAVWPAAPVGTVMTEPREQEFSTGWHRFYGVRFDSPQFDTDDDGPYAEAEINETSLTAASS
jgi:hypothetical protein